MINDKNEWKPKSKLCYATKFVIIIEHADERPASNAPWKLYSAEKKKKRNVIWGSLGTGKNRAKGLRITWSQAKKKMSEYESTWSGFKLKSLILAQDERWRRA